MKGRTKGGRVKDVKERHGVWEKEERHESSGEGREKGKDAKAEEREREQHGQWGEGGDYAEEEWTKQDIRSFEHNDRYLTYLFCKLQGLHGQLTSRAEDQCTSTDLEKPQIEKISEFGEGLHTKSLISCFGKERGRGAVKRQRKIKREEV